MVNKCAVPGCNTGYGSQIKKIKAAGGKLPSIFSVPKDPESLKKWNRAVPRKVRDLTKRDHVCELHFPAESIERFYETKLIDGTVFKMEKGFPILKADAIPSIFPKLPSYHSCAKQKIKLSATQKINPPAKQKRKLSTMQKSKLPAKQKRKLSTTQKSKLPAKRTTVDYSKTDYSIPNIELEPGMLERKLPAKSTIVDYSIPNIKLEPEMLERKLPAKSTIVDYSYSIPNIKLEPETVESFSFTDLVKIANTINKPNKWWSTNILENFIAWLMWDENCCILKKIIIDSNLNVQIFLKDKKIDLDIVKVGEEADLPELLSNVTNLKLCQSYESGNIRSTFCAGFTAENSAFCDICSLVESNASLKIEKINS